ncbi:MAG: SufD family Fe-S cluster assembly protein [Patescibacteria group bacterium]
MRHTIAQFISSFSDARQLLLAGVRFFPFILAPLSVQRDCERSARNTPLAKNVLRSGYIAVFPSGRPYTIRFSQGAAAYFPAVFFIAEPNSNITLFDTRGTSTTIGEQTTHVIARTRSHFSCGLTQRSALAKDVRYTAIVETDAAFEFAGFLHGTKTHAVRVATQLAGSRSVSNMRLALLCSQHSQTFVELQHAHAGPKTNGQIHLKAIVRDHASLHAPGWITVGKRAQKTNSFLREDVLLLSAEAEAKAVPNLEILHHDVRVWHNATVGQFSSDQLYYCASRGLTLSQTEHLLTKGFFTDLAGQMNNHALAQYYRQSLTAFL